MAMEVACKHCSKDFLLDDQEPSEVIQCPHCRKSFAFINSREPQKNVGLNSVETVALHTKIVYTEPLGETPSESYEVHCPRCGSANPSYQFICDYCGLNRQTGVTLRTFAGYRKEGRGILYLLIVLFLLGVAVLIYANLYV